ncbi:retrovirus-related pol polyprotein from transposon TNT 1-94 [Tanacetum coccineum]
MTTLVEHIIMAGAKNRPSMLEKSMYDSWKSRIQQFIKGKKHGRMMLDSIDNGPLVYPTIEEDGQTRLKKYLELTEAQQLQDDCDVQATNIILHGLPPDVYALVNHQEAAKYIFWGKGSGRSGFLLYKTMEKRLIQGAGDSNWRSARSLLYSQCNRLERHFVFEAEEFASEESNIHHSGCLETKDAGGVSSDRCCLWGKLMLVEAQEVGQILDKEQLAFIADPGIAEVQVAQQTIPKNSAFQTKDLDAYDSKFVDISSAKVVLMANLLSCDLDVLSEVPYSNTYLNYMINQEVQEMSYSKQTHIVDFPDIEITSDSNIIPYSQYLKKSQYTSTQDTNSSAPNDLLVLSLVKQITDHVKEKEYKYMDKEIVLENQNKELENTLSLDYQNAFHLKKAQRIKPTLYDGSVIAKEHDVIFMIDDEETLILEEESRSKMLNKQNDPISIKQKINISPIDYSKLNKIKEDFGKHFITKKELSTEQDFWLKHSNYNSDTSVKSHTPVRIEAPGELPKVSLVNESHKKLKYQLAGFDKVVKKRTTFDAITAGAWGFEYTKACFVTEIVPFLKVLKDTFNAFDKTLLDEITEVQIVFNQIEAAVDQCSVDKNTFEIQIKQLRINNDQLLKQIMSQEIVHIAVNSVDILNVNKSCVDECNKCLELGSELLKKKDLIEKDDNFRENQNASTFNQLFEINGLKAQSQEKDTIIRNLKDKIKSLSGKDSVESKRTKAFKSIYKDQFDSIRKTRVQSKEHCASLVAQISENSVENSNLNAQLQEKVFAIAALKNELSKLKGKNLVDIAVSNLVPLLLQECKVFTEIGYSWKPTGRIFTIVGNRCPLTRIASTKEVPLKETTITPVITLSLELKIYSRKPKASRSVGSSNKSKIVVQIVLWYLDSECSKHMTENRSQLINFVSKFLSTIRFGSDHIAKIMGYEDYQMGNVTMSRVYYVKGLGYNLLSVGQFCDSNLEVAFGKHTCFIRDLEGVNLLKGSRGSNLYTLSMNNLLLSSPICLLSKASKTKSWLWYRRLSHLNFDYITALAKQGLVRALPKLKYHKDHLCSACALGKSKKHSHKPKAEDSIQEKLYLLHMDLCGPMRIQSINGRKYILVIVDDYS